MVLYGVAPLRRFTLWLLNMWYLFICNVEMACRIVQTVSHTELLGCWRLQVHAALHALLRPPRPQNPRTISLQLRKTTVSATRHATLTEGLSSVKYLHVWSLPV